MLFECKVLLVILNESSGEMCTVDVNLSVAVYYFNSVHYSRTHLMMLQLNYIPT